MTPPNAGSVSAGEHTPPAHHSAASRLAALRDDPAVQLAERVVRSSMACSLYPEAGEVCAKCHAKVVALLSAVAAAATREAEREFCLCLLPEGADTINRVTTRMLDRRALAGGAPPATQTTDTTEE